jgi:hypothetical protein
MFDTFVQTLFNENHGIISFVNPDAEESLTAFAER